MDVQRDVTVHVSVMLVPAVHPVNLIVVALTIVGELVFRPVA